MVEPRPEPKLISCPDCGEPFCVTHQMHYGECPCPSQHEGDDEPQN